MTLECEKYIVTYEQFKCIVDLKVKIQSYIERIEQSLERSCSKICQNYNHSLYSKIVNGYIQLDKLDVFIEKLNLTIITTVNSVASNTLIQFIIKKNEGLEEKQIEDLNRKEFIELCKLIRYEDYRKVLLILSCSMWKVMKNYYQMYMWHRDYYYGSVDGPNIEITDKFAQEQCLFLNDKFIQGFNRLWQDVQQKISICFGSMCFDHFKFDEFIDILTINNRIIKYGQEYCNNKKTDCSIMIKATKDQTLAYFKSYHISHLEELKMFLENEVWQWCPVKTNFSIYKLQVINIKYYFVN